MRPDAEQARLWYGKAAAWYRQSAERGDMEAQFELAEMYKAGRGVPRDAAAAATWYDKAAAQGYMPAQFELGCMYLNGLGLARDEAKAREWLGRAAKQGHQEARRLSRQLKVR